MIAKSVQRFPACAKPLHGPIVWPDASAGEGRSDKIMRKQESNFNSSRDGSAAALRR
jgi:hypothetical protein